MPLDPSPVPAPPSDPSVVVCPHCLNNVHGQATGPSPAVPGTVPTRLADVHCLLSLAGELLREISAEVHGELRRNLQSSVRVPLARTGLAITQTLRLVEKSLGELACTPIRPEVPPVAVLGPGGDFTRNVPADPVGGHYEPPPIYRDHVCGPAAASLDVKA